MNLSIYLFKNDYKKDRKHPDFRARFELNGMRHDIAAWIYPVFKHLPGFVFLKVGLNYKETDNGKGIWESVLRVREVSKPSPRGPRWADKIMIGKEEHDIAIWDNNDRLGLKVSPIKAVNEKEVPFAEGLEPEQEPEPEFVASDISEPLDDLPF